MSLNSLSQRPAAASSTDTVRDVVPEGLKDRLGALIDQAGRQRMLSHRSVMFLALAGEGEADGFRAEAHGAVETFGGIVDRFMGKTGTDGAMAAWLAGLIANRAPDYVATTRRFLRDAGVLLDQVEPIPRRDLARLAEFVAGPLLVSLNTVVAALNAELDALSEAERHQTLAAGQTAERLLAEIEEIGVRVSMISINALIQATRAGEAGQGFAVIANEIKDLAGRMRAAVKRISHDLRTALAGGG